jgi:hypothetical protein
MNNKKIKIKIKTLDMEFKKKKKKRPRCLSPPKLVLKLNSKSHVLMVFSGGVRPWEVIGLNGVLKIDPHDYMSDFTKRARVMP